MLRQDLRLTCESTLGELLYHVVLPNLRNMTGNSARMILAFPACPAHTVSPTRSYELRVNRIRTRDQEIEEFVQHTDYLGLTSGIWVKDWYKFLISGPSHSVV